MINPFDVIVTSNERKMERGAKRAASFRLQSDEKDEGERDALDDREYKISTSLVAIRHSPSNGSYTRRVCR